MRRRAVKILSGALKFGLAAGLLYLGFRRGWFDPEQLKGLARNWKLAACGLAGMMLVPFVGALRWRALVRAQGIPLSTADALKLTYIGYFWSIFLPGAITGDVFKAYYIARDNAGSRKTEAVTTVVLDRLAGLLGLALLAAIVMVPNLPAMRSSPELAHVGIAVAVILAGSVAGLCVLLHPRLRSLRTRRAAGGSRFWGVLKRVDEAIALYRDHKGAVAVAIALSVVNHLLQCLVIWHFATALGAETIPIHKMLLLAPLGFMFNAIPITPGGAGLGEAFFQGLLAAQGFGMGAAAVLCWRLSNMVSASPGAIIWAAHASEVRQAREQEAAPGEPRSPGSA